MDQYNFMTFSIDGKINCIEYFRETQIFIATSKSIMIYNPLTVQVISQCAHSVSRLGGKEIQHSQTQLQEGVKNEGIEEQTFSSLQIHYYPSNISSQSQQNPTAKILGYLLVHYKLQGLSTYKIEQLCCSQEGIFGEINNQPQVKISFVQFTPIKFGSAFLKLAFLKGFYEQVNTEVTCEIKQKYLTIENCQNSAEIAHNLINSSKLSDFKLKTQQNTQQFFVFENDNQLFEIRKLKISQGKIQVSQSFQIDEESAKLSCATVTQMKYFQLRHQSDKAIKSQQFLILATEGGDLYLYNLPQSHQNKSTNSDYYLQPCKSLNIKKFLSFKPQIQDLDYSVTQIQLLGQCMALVLVRNCGILLLDLKEFTILKHLFMNTASNKSYYFSDARIIESLYSNLLLNEKKNKKKQQPVEKIDLNCSQNFNKESRIQSSILISSKNTLKKLFLDIKIEERFETTPRFKIQEKTEIVKTKCFIIEQINTPLIQGLQIVRKKLQQESKDHLNQNDFITDLPNEEISVFGHYQEGKIFYFTP